MKNILKYALMSLAMMIYACSDNDKETYPGFVDAIDSDALNTYVVAAVVPENPAVTFTITNPLDCKVESDQTWCDVHVTNNEEEMLVTLSVESNMEGEERLAKVTLSSPHIKKNVRIEIKQEASNLMELRGLVEDIKPEGEIQTITVMAGGEWKLSSDVDWITFDKSEGRGMTEVNMNVLPNDDGIIRVASIKLESKVVQKSEGLTYEILQCEPWETQVRIGDPGMQFDRSKMDARYPQMQEWMKAGVKDGIPPLEEHLSNPTKIFTSDTPFEDILNYMNGSDKYGKRIILLKNGEYVFNKNTVRCYHNDILVGESRDGVVIKLQGDCVGISLYNANNAGIRNLTIMGDYVDYEPDPSNFQNVLYRPDGKLFDRTRTIDMGSSCNCFVDNVKIINSASHSIWLADRNGETAGNNTIRDVEIDGAYNKDGGQGYLFVNGSYNLITGCKVTRIRHISFQANQCQYNVFYKNDVRQEVTFHDSDLGDNLIEYNKIILPETLPERYVAIMGPWSIQHQVGGKNFIYRNRCLEMNNNNKTPWSDNELYIGPWEVKPSDLYMQFRITDNYPKPVGRTFYPIVLK